MADALNDIIKTLVRSGQQQADGPVLPHWIQPGASVYYESQSAGKSLPAVVENIYFSKQLVSLTFPHAKGSKTLPFAQILGKSNPLRKGESNLVARGAPKKKSALEESDEDPENILEAVGKEWAESSKAKYVEPAPELGPQLKPDWVMRLEKERAEDLTLPEQVLDIDSSPEPIRKKDTGPEDLENPYALGPELSAEVEATAKAARVAEETRPRSGREGGHRGKKRSRSCSRSQKKARSPETSKDSQKHKKRKDARSDDSGADRGKTRREKCRESPRSKRKTSRSARRKVSQSPRRRSSRSRSPRRKASRSAKRKSRSGGRRR